MPGIDFGPQTAPENWDDFVSPNPLFNSTTTAAMMLFGGLSAVGFPDPAKVWIQGQYQDGAGAALGAPTMDLQKAISRGLPSDKPVNIICSFGESSHSVGLIMKPFRSSVLGGLKSLFEEIKPDLQISESFEEFVFNENGRALEEALKNTFVAGF